MLREPIITFTVTFQTQNGAPESDYLAVKAAAETICATLEEAARNALTNFAVDVVVSYPRPD